VHQVFLVIAKFPQLATDLAISGGSPRLLSENSEQRPAGPYFELPLRGVGRKPDNKVKKEFFHNIGEEEISRGYQC
jgi:hypothetical protein